MSNNLYRKKKKAAASQKGAGLHGPASASSFFAPVQMSEALCRPAAGIVPRHVPGSPALIELAMNSDTEAAQAAVIQRAHWNAGAGTCADIALAPGAIAADIQLRLSVPVTADVCCRTEYCHCSPFGAAQLLLCGFVGFLLLFQERSPAYFKSSPFSKIFLDKMSNRPDERLLCALKYGNVQMSGHKQVYLGCSQGKASLYPEEDDSPWPMSRS